MELLHFLLTLLCFVFPTLGQSNTLSFTTSSGGLQLGSSSLSPTIHLSSSDWPGVIRTAHDLAIDFGRVLGINSTVLLSNTTTIPTTTKAPAIIAGTIGKSPLIDTLIQNGKLDASKIQGKWESFTSQLISNPTSGVDSALVIAGSDKRGTIFGLYDISEQIGVSPWYWWADVPPTTRNAIYALPNTTKTAGPPSVKYRGIFLNDEQPSLTNWVRSNYLDTPYGAGYNIDFYERVFELLLRSKANYLWTAMWDNMFYVEANGTVADMWGVVMGTSHTEPMARATKEQTLFMSGNWDWSSNEANVKTFMEEGLDRAKGWETVWTLGMRGNGDAASPTLDPDSLEEIIAFQKGILADTFGNSSVDVPQMWCLYKEVGGYYQSGMTVPDDIILLWSDDNVGDISRLPLANETSRSGGAGVYYHFDYVGSPRDYKWINTIQLSKTWEQLHLAYEKNAREMWIFNVGDLKPLEIPISHGLAMGYDMSQFEEPESTDMWLENWTAATFGGNVNQAAASIMQTYGKLIVRRKYELLDAPYVLSVENYNEAENVLNEWTTLLDSAQNVYDSLTPEMQAPFFEMVLHPVLAGKTVQEVYIKAQFNAYYAQQGRTSTNAMAAAVADAFQRDANITNRYHTLLSGKWNHMMDQPHMGYVTWSDPATNIMPSISYLPAKSSAPDIMGISIQGSDSVFPGDKPESLIPMDPYMPASDSRYLELFTRLNGSYSFTITTNASFISLSPSTGTLSSENTPSTPDTIRANITVDWSSVPNGINSVSLTITSKNSSNTNKNTTTTLLLPIHKTRVPSSFHGFVESTSALAFEASHYTSTTPSSSSASYATIPNYGRTLSGTTLMPVTLPSSLTPSTAPTLSYAFYTFTATTTANITFYLGSSLNTDPTRPLKYAFAVDDGETTTVQPVADTVLGSYPDTWTAATEGDGYVVTSAVGEVEGGEHELKVWLLEPGVVLQRVVVDLGGVRSSYLGPPESVRV